jgi:NADH-quinone oxidoreductase subunit J
VIGSRNAITSVLFMIGCYLTTSFVFFIVGAEFIAVILIIIYVGAIAIPFISVI